MVKQSPTEHRTRLTSAELGSLWSSYMNDSMAELELKYFLNTVENGAIRDLLQFAVQLSENHLQLLSEYFIKESCPVPIGFTEQDANLQAPRLYTDEFMLSYLHHMGMIGSAAYTLAIGQCSRRDIRNYNAECLQESVDLYNRATDLMQSMGIYIRPPYIAVPEKVDFVQNPGFLAGWVGRQRPLTSIEISHLFSNMQTNMLGHALLIGFSQVAESKRVREFMMSGAMMAKKHIQAFESFLTKDDLPAPLGWDSCVTRSKAAPFSDKLMLFHTTATIAIGIGKYGASMAVSPRHDVAAAYIRLMPGMMKYAQDGAEIMIDNGWLEEPPQAVDRRTTSQVGV